MVGAGATEGRVVAEGVRKVFGDANTGEVVALGNFSLTVEPGQFVSLVGPSGCGKSTLLRLIAGLDTPTAGKLFLDGVEIAGPDYLRGLVFQDPTLFPWATVRGNVSQGPKARGVLSSSLEEVDELIKLVGLDGFERSYPHQLSGGMAQRVSLARALINHPRVLLLDEPLGALDAFTRMHMQDEIVRIWQERNTTMILVTHDVDEAIYLSDRIVIMSPRPGRVDQVIDVPFARPRARNLPDFLQLRAHILEILHFAADLTPAGYAI